MLKLADFNLINIKLCNKIKFSRLLCSVNVNNSNNNTQKNIVKSR